MLSRVVGKWGVDIEQKSFNSGPRRRYCGIVLVEKTLWEGGKVGWGWGGGGTRMAWVVGGFGDDDEGYGEMGEMILQVPRDDQSSFCPNTASTLAILLTVLHFNIGITLPRTKLITNN